MTPFDWLLFVLGLVFVLGLSVALFSLIGLLIGLATLVWSIIRA